MRSKLEGIERFTKRFGTHMKKGYIWKYPYNNLKYNIYSLGFKILKDKKGDIIDQENKKN